MVDTAGRLHTKSNLMDELVKLKRVVARQVPGAPHESLMVLEAPTGQNGLAQARMFHEAIGLTGLVLTKLDGTAKGGIVVRIAAGARRCPSSWSAWASRSTTSSRSTPKAFAAALVPES